MKSISEYISERSGEIFRVNELHRPSKVITKFKICFKTSYIDRCRFPMKCCSNRSYIVRRRINTVTERYSACEKNSACEKIAAY